MSNPLPLDLLTFVRPPWEHQKQAIARYADEDEFALWHDMGVGKTTTTISIMRWKYACAGEVLPTLIVSPVATLWNWQEEWKRNAATPVADTVRVVYAKSSAKRLKILRDPLGKIFIINPEALRIKTVLEELLKMKFKAVIVDEAHKFKNPKSTTLEALLSISDNAVIRGMLTGTPILKSYLDVWSQFRFLDKGRRLCKNFFVFRRSYFVDKNLGMPKAKYYPDWRPMPDAEARLTRTIDAVVSRVQKADCLDLPPLIKTKKLIPLSTEQQKIYETMLEDLVIQVSAGTCSATNALTQTLRLLQILSGYLPLKSDDFLTGSRLTIKDNPRLLQLDEDLADLTPNHKVIVWSNFADTYEDIIEVARKHSPKVAELTGRTKDREEQMRMFNEDPECRVIVSNPQAGGVGVNLIAASYSIWFSRGYSLGDRLQGEARNYRGGSEVHRQIVQIDYLAAGTIDEDVFAALTEKQDLSDSILDVLRRTTSAEKID